jgi:hypothetical protein
METRGSLPSCHHLLHHRTRRELTRYVPLFAGEALPATGPLNTPHGDVQHGDVQHGTTFASR